MIMFIKTRNTIINTEALEALTINGTIVTFHMANNDISINYGTTSALENAIECIDSLLENA